MDTFTGIGSSWEPSRLNVQLHPPKILKEPGDQSRLLLAYGLTRDITELHELRLPSEIEDIKPIPVQTFTMIDKDMV